MTSCCKNPKTTTQIADLAQVLKAIAEPNRLKILCMLSRSTQQRRSGVCTAACACTHCVCEIYEALHLSQNLTSHHLKVLRTCNLINCKKDGQWKHYSLNKKVVRKYKSLLNKILTP